jgi:hypothetical protein
MPSDRIANVVVCIVLAMTFDRKRCRATCSSKYSQAQSGLFPGSTHPAPGSANCWPRGGEMHVLGAGAWSCSRFQRAGALLSFPLNAFVLN